MTSPRRATEPSLRYGDPADRSTGSELSRRERMLLARVNRSVVSESTLEGVLGALFDAVTPLLACDRLSLAFLDERRERLTSAHVVAPYRPLRLKEGYSAALAGSSLEAVVERGVPRLIGDLEQYLADNPDSVSTRLVVAEGARSSMTCPLTIDGRTVGVLFLSSQKAWAFGEIEVRLFQAIADRVARVVERAWQARQIEKASRAGLEKIGAVVHELKTRLAGLATDARRLRSGFTGPVNERQAEQLDTMIHNAEHLLDIVNGLLDASRTRT